MKPQRDAYQSYLLRLWQEECDGVLVWRASVESVQTRQRWGFVDLPKLFAFLSQQIKETKEETKNDNRKES